MASTTLTVVVVSLAAALLLPFHSCVTLCAQLQVLSDESLISQLQTAVLNAQPLIQQLASSDTTSPGSSKGVGGTTTSCANGSGGGGAGGSSCIDDSSGSGGGVSVGQESVPVMMSGAGHDAMSIADITKIGMVFVRCRGGVSHNPAEFVHPRDVASASAAFATFMEMDLLDRQQQPSTTGGVAKKKDEL